MFLKLSVRPTETFLTKQQHNTATMNVPCLANFATKWNDTLMACRRVQIDCLHQESRYFSPLKLSTASRSSLLAPLPSMASIVPKIQKLERRNVAVAASLSTVDKTELDVVSSFSEVVPDTVLADDFDRFPPTAATVSYSFLLGLTGIPEAKFKGAIESALAYGNCYIEDGIANRMSCFMDKALVNVGGELAKLVPGRVSTEVDPRLANNTIAIVEKIRRLVKLYNEIEVPPNRVLFKIPATWQGIEAARQLEDDGIQTHVTGVHSFAQAAVCGQAKVSVIQISVGRIRDWARTNGGDKDVDSAVQRGKDPGIDLVIRACELISRQGHKTKVMASNVRNREDVLDLLGVDYIIAPVKVLESLKNVEVDNTTDYKRKINLESNGVNNSTGNEFGDVWDESKYEEKLGPCARQLLESELENSVSQAMRVEEHFAKIWPPPNV